MWAIVVEEVRGGMGKGVGIEAGKADGEAIVLWWRDGQILDDDKDRLFVKVKTGYCETLAQA